VRRLAKPSHRPIDLAEFEACLSEFAMHYGLPMIPEMVGNRVGVSVGAVRDELGALVRFEQRWARLVRDTSSGGRGS
jgi:hypothetical protein